MVDCETLRIQAAKCRRLADSIGDRLTEERLLAMARAYEREADPDARPEPEMRSFGGR